jgi:iron-sulfur cluster repair protein YtfE (RIC family)
MATTLPTQTHEHHERIMSHVDRMPALGDLIGPSVTDALRTQLDELVPFLTGTLVPHVDTAEQTLYPELERLQQNAHSMTPMRREHDRIRHLVDDLAALRRVFDVGTPGIRDTVALRRSVFALYALLKVHLAEEELYMHIVERGVSTDAANALAAAMDHPVVASA